MKFVAGREILGFFLAGTIVAAWVAIGAGNTYAMSGRAATVRPKRNLKPFSSERELKAYLSKIAKKRGHKGTGYGSGDYSASSSSILPPAAAPMSLGVSSSVTVNVTSSSKSDVVTSESITNTQHAGVDEGGIVKQYGDFLVVLRRGRLFTVGIGSSELRPISSINAFGPTIDPEDSWYDEMLISENNIVVIGYSYDRGGTEVGLFKIDRDGKLEYRSTYHLRSNDYYSSRNYSSRLIGNKLIFYSPLDLDFGGRNILDEFPAVRKWRKGAKERDFRRIVTARNVYQTARDVSEEDELTLHTVATCDLSNSEMTCTAKTVIGPSGHTFYVSPKSVYVWASTWVEDEDKEHNRSVLFKLPLGNGEPSAIRVSGGPIDQFSFLESEDLSLNVMVRAYSHGDGMWRSEVSEGETALLRLPSNAFGDGSIAAEISRYLQLEKVDDYSFQNRFVGDYLLYGTGTSWDGPEEKTPHKLHVVNWRTGAKTSVELAHTVERLDAIGADGIVVGTRKNDLFFTSIRLDNMPRTIDSYSLKDASQGETRSQGFFYKPDGVDSGMLGHPVTTAGRPGQQLENGSAAVIFLRNRNLRFSDLGLLRSVAEVGSKDDDCKASCVDWYGNARPIFIRGRIFALLGYELVEGSLNGDRIDEIRRVDFSPKSR